MLLGLNILLSVDFVNPQGMAILGNFTCGYMGYVHRGLWPLYFWPTHQRQALTKVSIIQIQSTSFVYLTAIQFSWLKSLFLQLKKRFWHLQEKKEAAWLCKNLDDIFSTLFLKRNDHCNNINSFKKGVTQ